MRKHGSGFFWKAASLLGIAVLALSACGGGDSDSTGPTPPSSPANLTADAGDNQVVLNWPSVSGAATYNVYYGTATPVTKSSTKITGSVSAPKTVTSLVNGTPYYFAVSAVNTAGESGLSVERSATPSATPPAAAPTNIRATAGDNQVTVSWDNVTGAVSYNIYYGTSTGVTKASVDNILNVTSPHVKTGLLNGTTYYFVVTAVNGIGEGAVSFEVSAKPTATPPPAAPSLTSATGGNAKATLVWGAVTGATSYNVYYGTATGVTKASGTPINGVSSPYDVTGLTNGTPYFFIVTSVGAGGESAASNERSATPTAPAGAFSQADLTGTWKVNMLSTSSDNTDNGWTRATGTVDGSGNLTVTSVLNSDGTTTGPAGTLQWIIDGSGVVSETGTSAGDNVHMTMTSNKNFIAGTEGGFGRHVLRVIQKVVPGTVYSNADLQSKSLVFHGLSISSVYNAWNHQDGTTDASGMLSTANDWDPSGNRGGDNNIGRFSVDGNGTVTIDTMPGFQGFLSADKKTIVATFTEIKDPNTYYDFMIIQISGQTYAAGDLVGTSSSHVLGVGNANFWSHYTATGAVGGVITFSSYLDSSGGTTAPSAVTASINSEGTVTLSDPSFQFHGTMSFDKKFTVFTQTNGVGVYSLSIMTQ